METKNCTSSSVEKSCEGEGGGTSVDENAKYVVGIGASAGGLDAIEELFQHMPHKTGAAFVVVQHLSPDFKSLMDEILSRHTQIPVFRVENEMLVKPDSIYLIPPRKKMIIAGGRLILTDQDLTPGINLPIDIFFRSLAQEYGPRAIGIVLSGSGSDGARGLQAIHDEGGYALVQDLESAKFDSMPRAAVNTTSVDFVGEARNMPQVVVEYLRNPNQVRELASALAKSETTTDSALLDIFELLRLRYGIDFRFYRATTVDRRLDRRMSMAGVKDLPSYVQYLSDTPNELNNLYQDLLIGVTKFFRDPEAFLALDQEVLPSLLEKAKDSKLLRVWVAGCATGEESYSLAIAIAEALRKAEISDVTLKIFSTDVHGESLEKAALGIYEKSQLADVPLELLERYFVPVNETFQVSAALRRNIVFAPQNIISDPPFTKMDLISCRNMLIYLEPALQHKALSLFHFALRTGGCLFLGPSESVGKLSDEFDSASHKWKIFVKRRDRRLPDARPVYFSRKIGEQISRFRVQATPIERSYSDPTITWAYEALLGEFVENGFLIDEKRDILHIYGSARQFIRIEEGRVSSNLTRLVDENLGVALKAALHRAAKEGKAIEYRELRIDVGQEKKNCRLVVRPLYSKRANATYFFCEIGEVSPKSKSESLVTVPSRDTTNAETSQQLADLESELQYAREHLQATNEELETSNEELQATNEELVAANEELQSTNEELQSTNEELQSTNEELHSVNEELHTVNAEYHAKIEELTQLNNDMENLLRSTEIGTIFLDKNLEIRKYTPAVGKLMNLLDRDIGRPIEHLSLKIDLDSSEIKRMSESVLNSRQSEEKEVRVGGDEFRCLAMRVMPYKDEKDEVQGIVIVFADISELKYQQVELRRYAGQLEASNKDLQDFAYAVSHNLQAPLRHIRWLTDQLSGCLVDRMDPGNIEKFNQLNDKADYMKELIQNLLEYSRVHTRGAEFEKADCSESLRQALVNLRSRVEASGAVVHQSALPSLRIDKGQMTRVFQNLIDNAIKFKGESPPNIHIGIERDDHNWVFRISDNGRGIEAEDQEEHDRAFMIFQKLHQNDELPGTGVGLAVTKRIVERHGGRIWFKSIVGRGSDFYFSLPLSLADSNTTSNENSVDYPN